MSSVVTSSVVISSAVISAEDASSVGSSAVSSVTSSTRFALVASPLFILAFWNGRLLFIEAANMGCSAMETVLTVNALYYVCGCNAACTSVRL